MECGEWGGKGWPSAIKTANHKRAAIKDKKRIKQRLETAKNDDNDVDDDRS